MDANRLPVSVPHNRTRTIELAPGQIWRLSAEFYAYLNSYQQDQKFKRLEGLEADFWRSQDLPQYVMLVKALDRTTDSVVVMPLSPRINLVNEFDLVLPATISRLDRDCLIETWHTFSLPAIYLANIAGVQFSQATYNLLMDVGDAYHGRAKLPITRTIEAHGLQTVPDSTDEQQHQIEQFREQEELWSELFKIPESHHYEHLKSISLANAGLQLAAQYQRELNLDSKPLQIPNPTPPIQKNDSIPQIQDLFGRSPELDTLKKWIVEERCKVVAISGSGGIGKTALAANLAEQVQNHFRYVFWQSLRNGPKLQEIAARIIEFLTDGKRSKDDTENPTEQLLHYLKTHSCLVILDNFDAIDSEYYESYRELLNNFQAADHQSCLVLTSRSKPISLRPKLAQTLSLKGLPLSEGIETLLEAEGLDGTKREFTKLGEYYNGNPLALKIAASMIKETFNNEIEEFLDATEPNTGLPGILERQFRRLSDLERVVIYWLAVNRESVTIEQLHRDISQPVASDDILKALEFLERRSLLERDGEKFTLAPLIMEYVTERFIQRICQEIQNQKFKLFNSHVFIKAQAANYIQQSQRQQILQPILEQLEPLYSPEELDDRLMQILTQHRESCARKPGYAATNTIAILRQIRPETLRGRDFSKLSIRQADFRRLNLSQADLSYSDLSGSVFTKTLSSILAISFHPDGQRIVTGDKSGNLRIWQVPDGELLATYQYQEGWIRTVSFSPDGTILASAGDSGTIRLWDVETGKCLRILIGHADWIQSIAFSHDGHQLVSTSDDYTVKVWDVATGTCRLTLQGHTNRVRSAVFSPDGQKIASAGDDQTVRFWDSKTGTYDNVLLGHKDKIFSLVFSPNGQSLASASADRTIRLWNVKTGNCETILKEHHNPIRCAAFSHDGRTIASGSEQGRIRLWEVRTGRQLQVLEEHTDWVRAIAFSPDDQLLASGSSDHTLKLWNPETQKSIRTLQGYACRVWSIAVHPEGKLLATANEDHKVRVWAVDGKCLLTLSGHTDWVRSVHFNPEGTLLASGAHDHTIRLWNIKTEESRILGRHENRVRVVRFSPDGLILASGGHDQTIRLWDVATGNNIAVLKEHQGCIRSLSFSADGQLLASCSPDRSIRIWHLATQECVQHINSCRLSAVQFHPSKLWLASAGEDELIRLWDLQTGQSIREFKGHHRWVQSVAFDSTGNYLVSGSEDQTVQVWNVQTGHSEVVLAGHTDWIRSVAFSPDGTYVLSGGEDQMVRVWDWRQQLRIEKFSNPKPYEQMNITGVVGLSQSEKIALEKLGAIDVDAGS